MIKRAALLLILAMLACNFPGLAGPEDVAAPLPTATYPPGVTPTAIPPSATPLPPTATPAPTADYTPVFEPGPCRFGPPGGYTVECGDLLVPQDRTNPDGITLRLHTAIFKSISATPQPDPVVYLSGGPGSGALGIAAYHMNSGHNRFLERGDYIMFDQRGTGFSQPSLACPETDNVARQSLGIEVDPEVGKVQIVEAFSQCRDRLVAQGVDLAHYNSAAVADDIYDLRRALGYDQLNLYGVSYGSRVALTVMRDHPDILRSVVLDSTYPLQVNLYESWPDSANRAFSTMFDACASQPTCAQAYPDLENVFYETVAALNAEPVTLNVSGVDMLLTGDVFVDVIFVGMYNRVNIPRLPDLIWDVSQGRYTNFLYQRMGFYLGGGRTAVTAGVQCNEEIPFSSEAALQAEAASANPLITQAYMPAFEALYDRCDVLTLPPANPAENQPVVSDIPTLVLAGQYDPITPPEWGALAAETLPNSYTYLFPAVGHWVLRSQDWGICGMTMTLAFLNTPTLAPASTCIDSLPGQPFYTD